MTEAQRNLALRYAAPIILFLLALLVWVPVLPPVPPPGNAANLLYQHLGLSPFDPLDKPVFGWLAKLLTFGGSAPGWMTTFSLLCGSLCAALVYVVMVRLPSSFAPAPVTQRKHSIYPVRALGAVLASLLFIVSLPIWIVSTRPSSSPLDLLLFLVSIYCLFRFRMSRRLTWAWVGMFIFSICLTGFGTMFAVAPAYGIVLLVYLMQNGLMRVRNILLLVLAGLAGLTPWLIEALHFMTTPAYEWREFKDFGEVLFYMLRTEYHGFKNAALQTGWLVIFLVSVLPWLIVIVFKLGQNRKIAPTSRTGGYILNVVLTCIAVLVSLGIKFDPWRYGNPQDPMVTPYLLIAMWFGGLASFWYVELIQKDPSLRVGRPVWQKILGSLILFSMVATVVATGIRNRPVADGRPARIVQTYLDQTLASLENREWFLTSGAFDDNLALAIRARGLNTRILSLPQGGSSAYLKYVATLFPESEVRLKGLAQVGLVPLFNEWTTAHPGVSEKIAIQNIPDLWFAAGREPQPQGLLYIAQPTPATSPDELFARHEKTWAAIEAASQPVDPQNPIAPAARWILAHTARLANNLGVYLEDHKRPDLALRAYQRTLALDTNNISAKLNLHTLYKAATNPAAQALETELRAILKNTDLRRTLWSLAYHHGFVRRPEAYVERGMPWALTGRPNLGLADLRRARELAGDTTGFNLVMGGLLLQQAKPEESEQSYTAVLRKDPTNLPALVGLLHVHILRQQFDLARGHIQRLRDAKAPPHLVLMQQAIIEISAGDNATALKYLLTLTKDYPEHWLGWTTLAITAHEIGDTKTLQTAQTRLAQARNLSTSMRVALASLALKQNDRVAARRQLEAALRQNPQSIPALEMLIRLDTAERNRESAERNVRQLLSVNPRNTLANYILASLQLFNGQYALAESSYRIALEAARTPEILNDLAWCLVLQGRPADAIPIAKEAVAQNDRNGSVWDTLGLAQLKTGAIADAEKSLEKATALLPDNPTVIFHIALLYEARKMTKESLALANQLLGRPAELDRNTTDAIHQLVRRLRQLPQE